MRKRIAILAVGWALLLAGAAPAQVVWDAPLLVPPQPAPGLGLFLVNPAGGELALLGVWRAASSRQLQLRLGIADDARDEISVYGGVDIGGSLNRSSAQFPLDVGWVLGAGLGAGDWVLLSIPLGLSIGRTFRGNGASFTPYLSPRVVLDGSFGRDLPPPAEEDELDLDFAVDLGIDLAFQRTWMIRFGATLGNDREALAIGVVF
ncbi:MAG: hypothetical protein HY703_09420 [Gemmatimonadetes bacterium]|nr:hypothetical protein [Gemmatimonadota bacterium]